MPRNIVVCCDGTGNEYGDRKTNVLKLHSVLEREGQRLFYDPGVGTFSVRETITRPGSSLYKALGLGFGVGFRQNVREAYAFIVEHFEPGDRIYLFGFSRGAYAARVVAALLRGVGVLPPGQENLIPYALQYLELRGGRTDWRRLREFRAQFSRSAPVGFVFLGIWDTVSSVSWAWDRLVYTATAQNRAVDVVRHAVSIDERRAFFRTNLWQGTRPGQDVKQVWFAGVHSDVGGSYPDTESGLSKLALEWMLVEARSHGLRIDHARALRLVEAPEAPDPRAEAHRSLKKLWWLLEIMPKRPFVRGRRRLRVNLARRRFVPGRPTVHASVSERLVATDYRPSNLPTPYDTEPWTDLRGPRRRVAAPAGARIQAKRRWNRTTYEVEEGRWYRFRAGGTWNDWQEQVGPSGETRDSLIMRLAAPLRRMRNANWFSVIGSIDRKPRTRFDIGELIRSGETWRAPATGTLYAFANDVPLMYWNNSGEIFLEMTGAAYLTKSRYTLARECPRKLYYHERPGEYENNKLDDSFLASLAEGGVQVGALARLRFPGGHEIEATGHDEAVAETERHLERHSVTLYEPAFRHGNLFVRVDVLVKDGDEVALYEVKAKSFDWREPHPFVGARAAAAGRNTPLARWEPYLHDIAFQTHVCRQAHPELSYTPHLVLVDKHAAASVDGLNQRLQLRKVGGRAVVKVTGHIPEADRELLRPVPVGPLVDAIQAGTGPDGVTFADEIARFASALESGQKLEPRVGAHCKRCEFRARNGAALRCGFSECWQERGVDTSDAPAFVFDVWNLRGVDGMLERGVHLARQLEQQDVGVAPDGEPGLSTGERQWLQVESEKSGRTVPYVDRDGLGTVMEAWTFPLHFIDFETCTVPIPFHAGRRPYEQIAFQFSHHVMHEDGRIEHAGEFLHDVDGAFPNFDFLRALKRELEGDAGTIFRYADHENSVLCQIFEQLKASAEGDREELLGFIRSVSHSGGSSSEAWAGDRDMVDLLEVLKRFYYHPLMGGSNSIKHVLPAVLQASSFLREKYSRPIYGAADGIPSRNFERWTWCPPDPTGRVIDPYKLLPSPFGDVDPDKLEFTLFGADSLREGGAAMTAYARMQSTEMSDVERSALRQALLRYCELDTLAMVMIVEHWREVAGAGA